MPHAKNKTKRITQPQYGTVLGEIPLPLPSAPWHLGCQGGISIRAAPENQIQGGLVSYARLLSHLLISILSDLCSLVDAHCESDLVSKNQENMVQDMVQSYMEVGDEWINQIICHSLTLLVLWLYTFFSMCQLPNNRSIKCILTFNIYNHPLQKQIWTHLMLSKEKVHSVVSYSIQLWKVSYLSCLTVLLWCLWPRTK